MELKINMKGKRQKIGKWRDNSGATKIETIDKHREIKKEERDKVRRIDRGKRHKKR